MKKTRKYASILLIALLIFALCGCVSYSEPSSSFISTGKEEYTLYPHQNTLKYNSIQYRYDIARDDKQLTYTITYPNGSTYYEVRDGETSTPGWSEDYWATHYASGETLVDILSRYYYISEKSPGFLNYFGALVLLAIGGFTAFYPEDVWHLRHETGFNSVLYEVAEPTDTAIRWTRYSGIFVMFVGIIIFFENWS